MAKALFKARRVVQVKQPAWVIALYHYCRQPVRGLGQVRWLSRYTLNVFFDDAIANTHYVYIRCSTCFAHRRLDKSELPAVWAESVMTVRLLEAVTRCE